MAHTGAGTGFAFDGKNLDAQQAASRYGAAAIRQISEESRLAVRGLIARGIADGIPPNRLAQLIKQTVGLTARQARGVANLDTQLRRAGIKPSRVKARVDAYRNRQILRRARNIARTETMGALNRGKLEAGRQAVKDGLLNNPEKRWVITPDERLCPLCSPMANETVPLEDSFSNGLDAPPRHPQCRCTPSITEGDERAASADLRGTGASAPPGLAAGAAPVTPLAPEKLPTIRNLSAYDDQAFLRDSHEFMAQHGVTLKFPRRQGIITHLTHTGMSDLAAARVSQRIVNNITWDARNGLQRALDAGASIPRHDVRMEWKSGLAWAADAWATDIGKGKTPFIRYSTRALAFGQGNLKMSQADFRSFDSGLHPAAYAGVTYTHELGHIRHMKDLQWIGPTSRRAWADYAGGSDFDRMSNPTGSRGWRAAMSELETSLQQALPGPASLAKKLKNILKGNLPGGYGLYNPLEFVAEIHSALVGGKTYPPRLMEVYRILGGPPVNTPPSPPIGRKRIP